MTHFIFDFQPSQKFKGDLHFGVVYALNLTLRLSILKVNNAEMVQEDFLFSIIPQSANREETRRLPNIDSG